jgi:hypothetical protein
MKAKGRIEIPCTFKKKNFNVPIEVVEVKTPIILGSHSNQGMGIVQKMFSVSQSTMDADENLTEKFVQKNYSDMLRGIGCLP